MDADTIRQIANFAFDCKSLDDGQHASPSHALLLVPMMIPEHLLSTKPELSAESKCGIHLVTEGRGSTLTLRSLAGLSTRL